MSNRSITLAMTGASGAAYGLRLLQVLLSGGEPVNLLISNPGRMVLQSEVGLQLSSRPSDIRAALGEYLGVDCAGLEVFAREDWSSPIASGSNAPRAMVVCPCTTGTLATIASGMCQDLIDRAADVVLKEGRKLILVVRETPFSVIHLENMTRLAKAGAEDGFDGSDIGPNLAKRHGLTDARNRASPARAVPSIRFVPVSRCPGEDQWTTTSSRAHSC